MLHAARARNIPTVAYPVATRAFWNLSTLGGENLPESLWIKFSAC